MLGSVDDLFIVLGFVVPGFVALYVRSLFVVGRKTHNLNEILSYLVVSVGYYAVILPVILWLISGDGYGLGRIVAWLFIILICPAVFGLFLGINVQKGFLRSFLVRFGVTPVHCIPTAWDWKFWAGDTNWVLVTLKDGTRFAGVCGPESFISSDPAERDIYIQRIYDIGEDNKWLPRGDTGVLITAGEIQTIEFWPYQQQERNDDEK